MKKLLALTIYLEIDMLEKTERGEKLDTSDDMTEFFFNESCHCTNNLLDGIQSDIDKFDESEHAKRTGLTRCICFCSEVKVIQQSDIPQTVGAMKLEHY